MVGMTPRRKSPVSGLRARRTQLDQIVGLRHQIAQRHDGVAHRREGNMAAVALDQCDVERALQVTQAG